MGSDCISSRSLLIFLLWIESGSDGITEVQMVLMKWRF